MKKSLAIICAIAVLISALGGTFLLAGAADTDVTTIVMPTFDGTLTVGEEAGAPVYVTNNQPFKVIENRAGLPLANLFECANDGSIPASWLKGTLNFQPNASAEGMMFYLEVHESSPVMPYFIFYTAGGNKYTVQAGKGPWYTLSADDTEWQEAPISSSNHTPLFEAGFKGYVYIPYTAAALSLNAGGIYTVSPDTNGPLAYMTIELKGTQTVGSTGYLPVGESFVMSAPMWVTGVAAGAMPAADKVTVDGVEYSYFAEAAVEEVDKYGLSDVSIVNPATLTADATVTNGTVTKVAAPGGVTTEGSDGWQYSGNKPNVTFSLNSEETKGAVAIMTYVKANADVNDIWFSFGGYDKAGTYWNLNLVNGKVSTMAKGATEWTEVAIDSWYLDLPADFEGYVKISLKDIVDTGAGKEWQFTDEGLTLDYFAFKTYTTVNDGDIVIGTPVLVYQEGATNKSIIGEFRDLTTGAQIGTVVPDDGTSSDDTSSDDTSSGDTSSDDTSSGDTSSDNTSSGDTSSDNTSSGGTAVQPDYKVPAYTGSAIDYSKFSIQNVTVGKLNGVVTVGDPIDAASLIAPEKKSKNIAAGTVTAVDSIIGITNYPSFKVNKKGGTYDDWAVYVQFKSDPTVTKNAVEVMHYIKLPAGKTANLCVQYNFTKEGSDTPYAAFVVNGSASLMAKGETEWTSTKVESYQLALPAGFEGYVKYSLAGLHVQANSGTKDEFAADTNKALTNTLIYLLGVEETDDVYLAAPIVITKGGSVPYAAFVDGETNAARNIFTGKVLTAADLKDFAGVEGNENLNQGGAPEINYKIPAYNGTAYTYGNYEFARIRQYELADNVALGYVISTEAFSDSHPDKNNGYSKLVDTAIPGISKMPFFSVTKSTLSAAEYKTNADVNVATFLPDTSAAANKGAGALMQYVKMPSDLEVPLMMLNFNFINAKGLRMNCSPYSGVVYYMAKGTSEWVSANITSYWFELPKGFEGWIMIETAAFKHQPGGDLYAPDWTLSTFNVHVSGLKNQTVVMSAPFLVDKVGDIDYAIYLNDETKAVRNIFTGAILKTEDVIKPLEVGDTVVKLPDFTTDFSVTNTNKDKLASGIIDLEWDSIDGAAKYIVRTFKKTNSDDGIVYTLVSEVETTETTASVTDLELNTQYAVVVYAYDAKGNEIAVFDYINANTAAVASTPTKPTTPSVPGSSTTDTEEPVEEGLSTGVIIAIIAAAVVVVAAGVVTTIIIIKKRKAKASK